MYKCSNIFTNFIVLKDILMDNWQRSTKPYNFLYEIMTWRDLQHYKEIWYKKILLKINVPDLNRGVCSPENLKILIIFETITRCFLPHSAWCGPFWSDKVVCTLGNITQTRLLTYSKTPWLHFNLEKLNPRNQSEWTKTNSLFPGYETQNHYPIFFAFPYAERKGKR